MKIKLSLCFLFLWSGLAFGQTAEEVIKSIENRPYGNKQVAIFIKVLENDVEMPKDWIDKLNSSISQGLRYSYAFNEVKVVDASLSTNNPAAQYMVTFKISEALLDNKPFQANLISEEESHIAVSGTLRVHDLVSGVTVGAQNIYYNKRLTRSHIRDRMASFFRLKTRDYLQKLFPNYIYAVDAEETKKEKVKTVVVDIKEYKESSMKPALYAYTVEKEIIKPDGEILYLFEKIASLRPANDQKDAEGKRLDVKKGGKRLFQALVIENKLVIITHQDLD